MTQEEQILYWLSSGKTITGKDAWSWYGCYRLSSVIHRLRSQNVDIITIIEEDYSQQGVKRYARYKMRLPF